MQQKALIKIIKKGLPPIRFLKLNIENIQKFLENPQSYQIIEDTQPKELIKQAIYLLKSGEYYKIGIANNVARRVKELNCRPYPVQVVKHTAYVRDATKVESALHEKYSDKRINGEWFNLD